MEQVFEVEKPYWWNYKKDMLTRQADCMRYAMGEATEFLRAVRTHEGNEKAKLEFGDIFFGSYYMIRHSIRAVGSASHISRMMILFR